MLFTRKITPVTAEEYGEATLEVEVSLDTGEVQWMRQGLLIHPGAKCTMKHKGRKHSLTIHKLAMSDRGTYSCETLHDRTQTQLTVERESAHVLACPAVACLLPLPTTPPGARPLCSPTSCEGKVQLTESEKSECNVAVVFNHDGNQQVIK